MEKPKPTIKVRTDQERNGSALRKTTPRTDHPSESSSAADPMWPVRQYFEGHRSGEPTIMRRAFHPEARLQGRKDGTFGVTTLETYLTWLPGAPAPDEEGRSRRVTQLHIGGDVAMAEVILDYPEVRFVDYLTLGRTDDGWLITNKAFQAFAKEPSK